MNEKEKAVLLVLAIVGFLSALHYWGKTDLFGLRQTYLGLIEYSRYHAVCPSQYMGKKVDFCYFRVTVNRLDANAPRYLSFKYQVDGTWKAQCYLIDTKRYGSWGRTTWHKLFPGDLVLVYGDAKCYAYPDTSKYDIKIEFQLYGKEEEEEEYGEMSVSCVVKDKYSRKPISGATCTWTFYPSGTKKSCTTDREGYCKLSGTYRFDYAIVKATKSGYTSDSERIEGAPPGESDSKTSYLYLEPLCRPGWVDEWKCEGNKLYRKYKLCVDGEARYEWRLLRDCSELSESKTECRGNEVVEVIKEGRCVEYRSGYAKCEVSERTNVIEVCEFACRNGECVEAPEPKPPVELIASIIRSLISWILGLSAKLFLY